jgi:glutaredoxin 3
MGPYSRANATGSSSIKRMILFIKNSCPYCKKVLDFAHANGIVFQKLKEKQEAGVLDELLKRGGKSQFPYLVDEENGIEMYESSDIVAYLAQKYGKDIATAANIGNVCPID